MIKNQNNQETTSSEINKYIQNNNLHIVGFGGAGLNFVEFLHSKKINANFTCIKNPERPNLHSDINFIKFIYPINEILNFDFDISTQISELFNKNENYILFSGLGGDTGAFLTVKIAKMLKEKKISFVSISSLPFKFEHSVENIFDPNTIANSAKEQLKLFPNCYFFCLEEMKKSNKGVNLFNFFKITNELIYNTIKSL